MLTDDKVCIYDILVFMYIPLCPCFYSCVFQVGITFVQTSESFHICASLCIHVCKCGCLGEMCIALNVYVCVATQCLPLGVCIIHNSMCVSGCVSWSLCLWVHI